MSRKKRGVGGGRAKTCGESKEKGNKRGGKKQVPSLLGTTIFGYKQVTCIQGPEEKRGVATTWIIKLSSRKAKKLRTPAAGRKAARAEQDGSLAQKVTYRSLIQNMKQVQTERAHKKKAPEIKAGRP